MPGGDGAEPLGTVLPAGRGRDEEFTAFMTAAAPSLARTAWLLCGDAHQADELVQQALVRTYLAWDRAREREPLAYARLRAALDAQGAAPGEPGAAGGAR